MSWSSQGCQRLRPEKNRETLSPAILKGIRSLRTIYDVQCRSRVLRVLIESGLDFITKVCRLWRHFSNRKGLKVEVTQRTGNGEPEGKPSWEIARVIIYFPTFPSCGRIRISGMGRHAAMRPLFSASGDFSRSTFLFRRGRKNGKCDASSKRVDGRALTLCSNICFLDIPFSPREDHHFFYFSISEM